MLSLNRRRLSLRSAWKRRYCRDRHALVWGLVDTGSEWDGIHICVVWRQIRQGCASNEAANDLTRAVWENRVAALRERCNGRGLDGTAAILAEEPWAFEPEPSYFEDMEEQS